MDTWKYMRDQAGAEAYDPDYPTGYYVPGGNWPEGQFYSSID